MDQELKSQVDAGNRRSREKAQGEHDHVMADRKAAPRDPLPPPQVRGTGLLRKPA